MDNRDDLINEILKAEKDYDRAVSHSFQVEMVYGRARAEESASLTNLLRAVRHLKEYDELKIAIQRNL